MSEKTHDEIDKFLFPDDKGVFQPIKQNSEYNDYNFSAKFIDDLQKPGPMRPEWKTVLSTMTANSLKPVLESQEGLCSQDACPTLAMAPSALADTLNSLSGPAQQKALEAVCLCEFGKRTKYVNDTAMGVVGGSALGFGVACVVTGGWGCLGAVVFGVITAGASEANMVGAFQDLYTGGQMSGIAQNLPSTTKEDMAQLRAYENGILSDLGISALTAAGAQGVVSGASYLLKGRGPAIAGFLKRLLPGGKAAEPAIAKLPAGATSLLKTADGAVLSSVKDPATGKLTYFRSNPNGTVTQLNMDPTGYALAVGGESRAVLSAAATNGHSVIILDANHLGLVNYMPKGLEGGDEYLKAIARIAYEKTGGKAVIARYGGDEYALVTDITDPVRLQQLTQDISDAVIRDPTARSVFLAQKQLNRYIYHSMRSAENYDQLPSSVKATLSDDEIEYARAHWSKFRETAMSVTNKMIYDSAAIQPSLSAGSAIVGGRSSTEAFKAANNALNCVKSVYKEALCLDTSKYRGRSPYIPMDVLVQKQRDLSIKPQTLPPQ
jgi:GGDEF domain-containing protein